MKSFLLLILILMGSLMQSKAQENTSIENLIQQGANTTTFNDGIPILLDFALVQNDSSLLKKIVHPDLMWIHSNGWKQNYQTVIADLGTKVRYEIIIQKHSEIIYNQDDSAVIKRTVFVEGEYKTTAFDMELMVEEVWLRVEKSWQLRQRTVLKSE